MSVGSHSRCVFFVCLAVLPLGAEGLRKARVQASPKSIAGVPILQYDRAYGGKAGTPPADAASLAELEEYWVVMAKPEASDAQLTFMCEASECIMVGHPDEGGVSFLEVRGTERSLQAVLERGAGLVEFVEPDLEVYAIADAEAEIKAQQGQERRALWNLERIGASKSKTTGKGANIYILDTGIRTTHKDFKGRASSFVDMAAGGKDCKGAKNCAVDKNGHGTHCAGSAAGATYGVAPGAKLFSAKVLGDDGRGYGSWIYGGLDKVVTKGSRPAVASMSLGGAGVSSGYRNAVDKAVKNGVTVVVAAGNENKDACNFSPAFVPNAITVGSIAQGDVRSGFSNFGKCTNIWAPGSYILSTYSKNDTSTATLSGTSMACPQVAGGAALLLGQSKGSTPAQVRKELLKNAYKGEIKKGLRSSDTNALLRVG